MIRLSVARVASIVTLLLLLGFTDCKKRAENQSAASTKPSQPPIYLKQDATLADVLGDISADDEASTKAKQIVTRAGEQWCSFITEHRQELQHLLDEYHAAGVSRDDAKLKQIREQHAAMMKTLPTPDALWPQVKQVFPPRERAQLDALWSANKGVSVADQLIGHDLHEAVKKVDTEPKVTGPSKPLCLDCHLPADAKAAR